MGSWDKQAFSDVILSCKSFWPASSPVAQYVPSEVQRMAVDHPGLEQQIPLGAVKVLVPYEVGLSEADMLDMIKKIVACYEEDYSQQTKELAKRRCTLHVSRNIGYI